MVATKPKTSNASHGLDVGDRVIAGRKPKRTGTVTSANRSKVSIAWDGYEPASYTKTELGTYLIQKAEEAPVPPKQEEAIAPKTVESAIAEKDAVTRLPLAKIRTDGGTQPRAELNQAVVEEYAAEKREGAVFPPATVFFDGTDYWLADGFHRFNADKLNESEAVEAIVRQGTQRDAILYSVGANSSHGLRRSNADKRRAVQRLLEDGEWSKWSDREIARRCGVNHEMVGKLKIELSGGFRQIERIVQRGGTTYTQDTSRIGKSSGGSGRTILGIRTDREQLLPSIPANPDTAPDSEPKPRQWQPGDWVRANQVGSDIFKQWAEGQPLKISKVEESQKFQSGSFYRIWLQRADGESSYVWNNWVEPAAEPAEEAPKSPAANLPEPSKSTFDPYGEASDRAQPPRCEGNHSHAYSSGVEPAPREVPDETPKSPTDLPEKLNKDWRDDLQYDENGNCLTWVEVRSDRFLKLGQHCRVKMAEKEIAILIDPDGKEYLYQIGEFVLLPPPNKFDPHGNPEERTDEHYTPKYVWQLALKCFECEQFDLDPCSNSRDAPNVPAAIVFTKKEDGLARHWTAATLWMNPPYSHTKEWVKKLIAEYKAGNVAEAIALVKGDFSTKWFQLLLDYPICLVNHRIKFINDENDGNSAKFASALVYLGSEIEKFYQTFDTRYAEAGIGIVVQAGVRGIHFAE